jgi:hypothetical protein
MKPIRKLKSHGVWHGSHSESVATASDVRASSGAVAFATVKLAAHQDLREAACASYCMKNE